MLAPFLSVSFSRAQGRVTFRVCNFLHTPEPLAHDTTRTTHTTHTHTMLCQQVDTMTLTQPPDTYSKRTHRPPRLLQSNGLRPKSSSWPPAQPSATLFVERQTKHIVTSRPIRKLTPFQLSKTHTPTRPFVVYLRPFATRTSSKQQAAKVYSRPPIQPQYRIHTTVVCSRANPNQIQSPDPDGRERTERQPKPLAT